MSQTDARGQVDRSGRHFVRGVLSLAIFAVLLYWLVWSLFLAAFKCGDNCGAAEAEHWRWTVQFAIAGVGSVAGIVALALGYTSRTRAYRNCLAVALGCALIWVVWVLFGGNF